MDDKWRAALDLVRQSGGGGGGVETANIMLAQLNSQKAVKSKYMIARNCVSNIHYSPEHSNIQSKLDTKLDTPRIPG